MITYVLFLKKIRISYFLPLLVIFALCFLQLPSASAATVTVSWDVNTEPDIEGYILYYGTTSPDYLYNVDVGNSTSCTISGLEPGQVYYFAATAYNAFGESGYSAELAHTIPITPPPGQEWLEAHFESDEDDFSYAPDTFNSTAKPNYSTGNYAQNGGFAGGGLRVFLGPGSTGGATSGGWSRIFHVDQDGMAQVTVSFRLIMDQGYETNEYGEVILEIDGIRYGDDVNNSLVHVVGNGNGGDIDDTDWLTESFTMLLSAGDHELVIGAYNNNATYSDESVEVFIDDITISPPPSEDNDPPNPAPMWATAPHAQGTSSVSMAATTASDPSGVEYYFEETSGNPGGTDSGWQDNVNYTDSGLNADTEYSYRVKARDKSTDQNETSWSSTSTATTDAEPKSGCGAAPMSRESGQINVSAVDSFEKALLPIFPSIMALGLWSLYRAGRRRKKQTISESKDSQTP